MNIDALSNSDDFLMLVFQVYHVMRVSNPGPLVYWDDDWTFGFDPVAARMQVGNNWVPARLNFVYWA